MMLLDLDLGAGVDVAASMSAAASAAAAWWRRWSARRPPPNRIDLDTLFEQHLAPRVPLTDAVLLIDDARRIVRANDRAVASYGYTRDELLHLRLDDLRAAATLGALDESWHTLLSEGRAFFETVHRRKDGSEFHVEVSVRAVALNEQTFLHSIVRDITDRIQATSRISRLHRLHAVLSRCGQVLARPSSDVSLCQRICDVTTTHGGFRLASAALVDAASGMLVPIARSGPATGYLDRVSISTRDEPLGRGPAGTCLREGTVVITQDIQAAPTMQPWHEAAAEFGLRASVALPLRREGRTVGVLSFYADEAQFFDGEETQLATELAASLSFALDSLAGRERVERVLEAMNEGFWDHNLTTGEVHVSPRLEEMVGAERGALDTLHDFWRTRVHPEDRALVAARLEEAGDPAAGPVTAEFRVQRETGEYIWVQARTRCVASDLERGQRRLVGTLADITARRALEDQFLQSQKLETVGRLAGGVAHDFNNVLTVVNGYSDLLLGRMAADDTERSSVEAIRQAGERAASITRQLLTFSRDHASQPEVVSIAAAVREIERLARGVLREEVKLTTRIDSVDDHVFIDPAHLHQVLMNLVVNASDAMRRGGSLLIETSRVDVDASPGRPHVTPGRFVCLTVADTGEGMDAETMARIFEPFFTTKEQGRGTGLGLSTVHGIVHQSGGFVTVHSERGVGTSFRVYLPATNTDTIGAADTAQPATAARGTETILVVEDQYDVREVTVAVLRSWGYTVLAAAGGDEAIRVAAAREGAIALLLTDVIMPAMDGRRLSEQLSAARPGLRTIFMSGYPDAVMGRDRVLGPDVHYLPKPFTPDRLVSVVREVLGPPTSRPTVLIVDDDPGIRRLFADTLSDRYVVHTARDGVECIELLRTGLQVDLVILDLFMPKQDGTQTIQALQTLAPSAPVIAVSGAFGGQFLASVERLGVAMTMTKPVKLDVLRRNVDRLCRSRVTTSHP